MPELPEVETTRAGIAPYVEGETVAGVVVRQRQLRYPVPASLKKELSGRVIEGVERRGKYLLLTTEVGTVIIHLGMSGSLRMVAAAEPAAKHDHVDIVLANGKALRLHDPRRFGAVLWSREPVADHPLIKNMGPEPLSRAFNGRLLFEISRGRRQAIKTLIMDSRVVVGVGNIYANEALYMAGIDPRRPAGRLTEAEAADLVKAIKQVLRAAIRQGGTTLRDFVNGEGKPGYFSQRLKVYGRVGEPCLACNAPVAMIRLGQRATYYCPRCQS